MIQNHHHHLWAKLIEKVESCSVIKTKTEPRVLNSKNGTLFIYFLFYIKTFLRKLDAKLPEEVSQNKMLFELNRIMPSSHQEQALADSLNEKLTF